MKVQPLHSHTKIFLEYKSRAWGWSQKSNKATSLSSDYPDNKVKVPTSHLAEATMASHCIAGALCEREKSQHRAGCQMPLASIQWREGRKKSHPCHIIYAMAREKGEPMLPEADRNRHGCCCGSMPSEPVPSELCWPVRFCHLVNTVAMALRYAKVQLKQK